MSEMLKRLLRQRKITEQQYDDVLYAKEQKAFVEQHIQENQQPDDAATIIDQLSHADGLLVLDQGGFGDTPRATLILGGPGSGKSTIIEQMNELAIAEGEAPLGVLIDSDIYKEDVMEFYGLERQHIGKSAGHELSDEIARAALNSAIDQSAPYVQPMVGKSRDKIEQIVSDLYEVDGYEVNMVMLEISPENSALSTINRLSSARDENGKPVGQFVDPDYAYNATEQLDGAYEHYVDVLGDKLHGHALINNDGYQQLVIESTGISGIPSCSKMCRHSGMTQSEREADNAQVNEAKIDSPLELDR